MSSSLAGNIALIRAVRVRNNVLLSVCPERSGQSPWGEAAEAAGRTGDPDGQEPVPRVSHRLPSAPLLQPLTVLLSRLLNRTESYFPLYTLSFLQRHVACEIIVPQPEIEPGPSTVRKQSPNHWTTREFPTLCFKKKKKEAKDPSDSPKERVKKKD